MLRWYFGFMLRLTYSSELGAATAYRGHAKHLKRASDRPIVAQVEQDELHHRAALKRMLDERQLRVWPPLEWIFWMIGSSVAFGCRFWGDWASAAGAAAIEVNGVAEYDRLAALARRLGEAELVPAFEAMSAQEAEHRAIFKRMARGA